MGYLLPRRVDFVFVRAVLFTGISNHPWSTSLLALHGAFGFLTENRYSLDSGAHGSYRIVSRLILSSIGGQSNIRITSCSLDSGGGS